MDFQFMTTVNGERRPVQVHLPIINSAEQLKYAKAWSEIQMEYFTKCKELEEKIVAITTDIAETLQFTANAKIPYNWEPLRMDYCSTFENMLSAAHGGLILIRSLPHDVQFYQEMVVRNHQHSNHETFVQNLEHGFLSIVSSLDDLEEDFKKVKAAGQRAFNASQLVPKPCGF